MNHKRTFLSLVFFMAAIILIFPQVHAEPVLIKLTLEKPSDYKNAVSLGVVAYQRLDNFVLAEFEGIKLGELEKAGLKYQIIDEHPWSEEYFLVSPVEGIPKVNLELYGKVLLQDPKWQLLKTSKEKAIELRESRYNVIPIHRKPIPLKYKPPLRITKEALKYSMNIDSLVNLISADSLRTWDTRLQNFQTRYSYIDSIYRARDWLFNKFKSFGIDSVWLHHYYYDSDQYNVVATVVGTATPDKVIVVGGHYDSIVLSGNPLVWAPGADDNASGTVATLEMARIIAQNPLPVTVMFVPFAQEEQGLIGSEHFAEYLYDHSVDVQLMINTDMIGHSVDLDTDVLIYADQSSIEFADIMIAMGRIYTYLSPWYGGPSYGSDQYSFYLWGYDAVCGAEGDFFTNGWHTNYDVVDSLDFSYMREVVKMCLATILFMVNPHPSPVENLKPVDAGDGHTLYLSWSANPPEENVVYYKVNFGTSSGNYDSMHQVNATCDTLRNLVENTRYFIAVTAVDTGGFESAAIKEISMAPRTVPLPPTGLVANPSGRFKVKLRWLPNQEADFDYYNIFRSQDSLTGYQLLFGPWRDTTFVDSTVQSGVEYYYYTLTAVDTSGNESEMSDEAESYVISFDQGILLVDMTLGTTSNGVESDSVNAFYQRALEEYDYTSMDRSSEYGDPLLTLQDLSSYPIVIVHSEDEMAYYSLNKYLTYPVLKQYLDAGGALLIEGRKNLSGGSSIAGPQFLNFLPGDFRRDYLNIDSAYIPFWNSSLPYRTEEFIGADRTAQKDGYPETVQLDTFRVNHAYDPWEVDLDGKLPGVGYFSPLDGSEVIYTFLSAYDTSASDGKPVALKHLTDDFAVIYFDFPLYFVKEDIATQILHQAISDLRTFTHVERGDEGVKVPASFSLQQNYPNPFNSETVIEYFLSKQSSVKITIYNILGQRVKTLLDQKETAGYKKVIWDGKNEKGRAVSSGIYFYRMETEKFAQTKKMLLLK
jgi:hypothetical protein